MHPDHTAPFEQNASAALPTASAPTVRQSASRIRLSDDMKGHIRGWISDCCNNPGDLTALSLLYESFDAWAKEGKIAILGRDTFVAYLRDALPASKPRKKATIQYPLSLK